MTTGNGGSRKQRLELTWIGKDERPRLEPRILLPVDEMSYAKGKHGDGGIYDNILIQGDNLLALKSLEQDFAGKVKCVYIDPPYNTGQAFDHYDDGLEHSLWLSLIRERLEMIRKLMRDDGIFFMQLNDDEAAYAKVLCDEVFGRQNYLNQIALKTKLLAGASGGGEDKKLKKNIEYLLVYAKDMASFGRFRDVYEETDLLELIEEMEDDGKSWKYTSVFLGGGKLLDERRVKDGEGNDIVVQRFSGLKRTTVNALVKGGADRETAYVENFERIFSDTNAQTSIRTRIIEEFGSLADGEYLVARYVPRSGRDKGKVAEHYYVSESIRRVIWLKDAARKRGRKLVKQERIGTLWSGISWNNVNKEGGVEFSGGKKPEELIRRVIELSTEPGDIVLDSFAGSGSTGAAAHKMGRRWIMIELGMHAQNLVVPRLKKVIQGEDGNGITEIVGWAGGGGFRFYKLAPSLIETDQFGQKVISKQYNAAMLAEAMCKHMGFTYAPSQDAALYWQQGHSSERDFIYTTTQALTHDTLKALSHSVGPDRSLLICCKAFRARLSDFSNLTVKKIPQSVLDNCEWGRNDYSLNIAKPSEDSPDEPDDGPDDDSNGGEPAPRRRGRPRRAAEPATEVQAAPIRKAPLKMDGTTRAPKPTRPSSPTPAAPSGRPTATKPAAASAQPPKPPAKRGRPPKPKDEVATKAPTKVTKDKPPAKTKPGAKAKSRRPADDRQGRLL